jgi:hypothetical protein
MGFTLQPEFLALWRDLPHQARPSTQDEALCRIATALQQTLGDSRLLFYLRPFPPDSDSSQLLPCPARPLGPDVFVYQASRCKSYFAFETDYSCCLPLMLNFQRFGYLFWESKNRPIAHSTVTFVAILAGQIAHYLNDLGYLGIPCFCPVEPPAPLKLDPIHRRVWVGGKLLPVNEAGFIFLELLQQWYEKGQPCPRELLYQMIYGDEVTLYTGRDPRLNSLVNRLRAKLDQVPGRPVQIETIRRVGFQLRLCSTPSLESSASDF